MSAPFLQHYFPPSGYNVVLRTVFGCNCQFSGEEEENELLTFRSSAPSTQFNTPRTNVMNIFLTKVIFIPAQEKTKKKKLYMYTFAFICTNRLMEKKDILHNIVWCKNRKTSDLCPRISPKAFFRSLTCIQLHFWQLFYVSARSLLPKTNVLLYFQQTALTIMLWIFENYSFIMEHNETILVNS